MAIQKLYYFCNFSLSLKLIQNERLKKTKTNNCLEKTRRARVLSAPRGKALPSGISGPPQPQKLLAPLSVDPHVKLQGDKLPTASMAHKAFQFRGSLEQEIRPTHRTAEKTHIK